LWRSASPHAETPLPKIFTGKDAIEKLAVILAIVDFQRDELSRDPSLEYLAFIAEWIAMIFRK
jgi:hypothetical protein